MPTEIGLPTLLSVLLLAAMTFALAYSSIVMYVSRGLISHYAKADVRKRLLAGSIDGLLVVTLCILSVG